MQLFKRLLGLSGVLLLGSAPLMAQKIDFTEYNLDNGLHVILHHDKSAPVVNWAEYRYPLLILKKEME